MSSLRFRLIGPFMRFVGRWALARAHDPTVERKRFARLARIGFVAPRGITPAPDGVFAPGGAHSLWLSGEKGRTKPVILHFHGGGYLVGSPQTHWKPVGHLARLSGLTAFLPSYRLAPEHPFPAAIDDAVAAWKHLRSQGYEPGDIFVGGDSAGGGIAAALVSFLCETGEPPGAMYLWSPFLDQSFSGASVAENSESDHFFPVDRLAELTDMTLGGADPRTPRASPLFAGFDNPPATLLQASSTEILRDDAIRMAARLREAGGEVELDVQDGLPHAWQLFVGWFPEARAAVKKTAEFLVRQQ